MNTADYLLECGRPDDPALIGNKKTHTYRDLKEAAGRVAAELAASGIQPGDRVGLLGNNSFFWAAAYLATMKLGAVAVPLPSTIPLSEVQGIQDFVQCKVVCSERRAYMPFAAALPGKTIFEDVLATPGPVVWPAGDAVGIDDDAALMFTSGTTQRPRLVRVTHGNIQANTNSIVKYLELGREDRVLAILQFFYCFGTSLLHSHLRAGGSVVMATSFTFPELIINMMDEYHCTGFAGVPSTYQTLLRNSTFPRRTPKSLTKLQQAGGKLQPVLIQELVNCAPQAKVYVMYGQTEATARLSYLPPSLLGPKLGSIGKGIPGVTLKVIGEDGCEVRPTEVGEIYAWGDNISPGYWHDEEASKPKFIDGVLHTGDLATVDEDGFIYVVDRKADFIKSYGNRVSSQRIEEAIVALPDVVAAAVIGEPDLERGEAIWAFVVRRSGAELAAQDILRHCRETLAAYMVPKEVVFLERLPMNAHGKIVKNDLRAMAKQQSGSEAGA